MYTSHCILVYIAGNYYGLPGVGPPQTYTSTPSPGAKLDPISTVSMYLASKEMLNGRKVPLRKRFSQDLVVKLARYSIFYVGNNNIFMICVTIDYAA